MSLLEFGEGEIANFFFLPRKRMEGSSMSVGFSGRVLFSDVQMDVIDSGTADESNWTSLHCCCQLVFQVFVGVGFHSYFWWVCKNPSVCCYRLGCEDLEDQTQTNNPDGTRVVFVGRTRSWHHGSRGPRLVVLWNPSPESVWRLSLLVQNR